jgi:hypothetical protein
MMDFSGLHPPNLELKSWSHIPRPPLYHSQRRTLRQYIRLALFQRPRRPRLRRRPQICHLAARSHCYCPGFHGRLAISGPNARAVSTLAATGVEQSLVWHCADGRVVQGGRGCGGHYDGGLWDEEFACCGREYFQWVADGESAGDVYYSGGASGGGHHGTEGGVYLRKYHKVE